MIRKPFPKVRDWRGEIVAAWRSSIEGVFRTGDLLIKARDTMGHGNWQIFVEEELPFGYATANRLCKIAECEFLREVAHAKFLPASYTTLAELAALSESEFTTALSKGAIRPDMQRYDVRPLRRSHVTRLLPAPPKESGPRGKAPPLGRYRVLYVRACDGLPDEELEREIDFCTEALKGLMAGSDDETD